MSLRSEYSHSSFFNVVTRQHEVKVYHRNFPNHPRVVGEDFVEHDRDIPSCADRLISAHMEKVTRILEGGPIDPDKAEEADRLAHKADHDNQSVKDLED